ncbi:MAG TPA: hypothetical protein VK843_19300 [Planctomycetota bacterium]|nr:hypothetical protein [Planctomycetota bacterium]
MCSSATESIAPLQQESQDHAPAYAVTWRPASERGHTLVEIARDDRMLESHVVDFEVEHGLVSSSGRIALGGWRPRDGYQECVLSLGKVGIDVFTEQAWPITKEDCLTPSFPRIMDMFVNDTARILFVSANTQFPGDFDATAAESWWRMSLDTGVWEGTTYPRDHWEQVGQAPQHGFLVSCEEIPSTPLLLAHWAAVRGPSDRNMEVGERIQILDKDAYVLGELPIRQFVQVIPVSTSEFWWKAAIERVRASPSKPTPLGPFRVGLFGEDEKHRTTLVCSPSAESPVGWSFLLYPAR